jgi:leucyl aminopeptidase (aminopeptidase T)
MEKIQLGARQAVENCMKILPIDNVVIVTDKEAEEIATFIEDECKRITKKVKTFILEEFGTRPLITLPKIIEEAIKKSTAVFYTAHSKPGEKVSLRLPIIRLGTAKGRQAHMPGITKELMETGMLTDYFEIKTMSKKVFDIVKNAKEIKVTTKLGTNFTATFNKNWNWIICDGDISSSPMKWSNLPDGEVFTCPLDVNGTIIADGSIGDHFHKYNPLEKHPVKIEVKDSKVISISSNNKKLEEELKEYIKQDKNASKIGEFAIGTNIGLKELTGKLLQDEKFPGVHIAIGDSYPNETLAPFPSKAHCDLVIKNTTIIIDNKMIMKSGKFLI